MSSLETGSILEPLAGEPPLILHEDRLFPADPPTRAVARRLFAEVEHLPIVSPHGHVDPALLLHDLPFADPATLLVTADHYVLRLLHSQGVAMGDLGLRARDGDLPVASPREVWRQLCTHWAAFRGTSSRLWLDHELHELFGVRVRPSVATADRLFDHLVERLVQPGLRPRALYQHFGIEVLATTDSPLDDLSAHAALTADRSWSGRVVPTFRPDALLDVARATWVDDVTRLGELTGEPTTGTGAGRGAGGYRAYLDALTQRRAAFIAHGATATDHGHATADTTPLDDDEAEAVYGRALMGKADERDAAAFRAHMLHEMARMSCEDGLVMQIHPAVLRNHDTPMWQQFGADTGGDFPVVAEFTRSLRPLLEDFGTHPNFTVVVFTTDETVYSRELGPLASYYPAMRLGAPWWFLDAPDAMLRFRAAVSESAGFFNTAGFVDDTRAYCSIPARHDVARRIDCAYLARLVAEHRLDEDEAAETARALAYDLPKAVFRV